MSVAKKDILQKRADGMMSLMVRYAKRVHDLNSWLLPYVYNMEYRKENEIEIYTKEFICHTDVHAFAVMIFEAQMLPVKITIVGCRLASLELEFKKMIEQ